MKYKINIKLITFTEKKVIHNSDLYVYNEKDLIKAINEFSNQVYMSGYVKINVEEVK